VKFNEAFDKVFDTQNDRLEKAGKKKIIITPASAKLLAFAWNVIAIANNKMDDLAYIDDKNNIISVPLPEKEPKEPKPKAKPKAKK
jgi:hypothetical protein